MAAHWVVKSARHWAEKRADWKAVPKVAWMGHRRAVNWVHQRAERMVVWTVDQWGQYWAGPRAARLAGMRAWSSVEQKADLSAVE